MKSLYNFDGLKVTSFESRRAKEIEKLIRYHGGVPRIAPSMREIPLSQSTDALKFAKNLIGEKFDIVILMTGVGTRALLKAVTTKYPEKEFIKALKKTTIVVRGPKPVAALREMRLKPNIIVPEPNTWRDVLTTLDSELQLKGKRIAIQEYGISNKEFIISLRKKGAKVTPVPIYKWALPEDLEPLHNAIKSIKDSKEDISIFTSSQQIYHLFEVASQDGSQDELKEGFKKIVIASIGPTTSETLNRFGLSPDYEPDSPKMGNLIREVARLGKELVRKKRTAYKNGVNTNNWRQMDMVWSKGSQKKRKETTKNSVFMKACRLEETDYTPIWLMRQAGRYMREYREIRSKISFLELCKTPELAAEVTLSAVDRLGVDAAIIFADILLIVEPLGVGLEFSKGEGPRIKRPVRSGKAVDRINDFDPESLQYVYDALKITRRALDPKKALIGFAGAPFTVASYMIEGGGSRTYENTKGLMYKDPGAWHTMMEKLSTATASYLNNQIKAGADAVQLFDSWVGCLSRDDYKEFVLPHMKKLISEIHKDTPVIHFGTGTGALLDLIKESGSQVIGLDWRVDLAKAWRQIGYDKAVQGNLDPVLLFSTPSEIRRRTKKIMDKAKGRPGFIFNLGHGILPKTPVDNVLALIDFVHEYSTKK
ncbi:MAG: uroporphyrinogen decarboxylase [Candidatus Dadabacteria bacterium]|nr:MAG: uroporphyrinogen decarboxylase [Candidatus Dadabacteria bacterium]